MVAMAWLVLLAFFGAGLAPAWHCGRRPAMAFWWGNHKQAYRYETDSGYAWCGGRPRPRCHPLLPS